MSAAVIKAHWDGEHVVLDDPADIPPNARLIVTVLSADAVQASDDWALAARLGIARAYSASEPDYSSSDVKS